MTSKPLYANPLTDFAFKRLFGTEANKDILIDFLNCLVKPEHQIANITFGNIEIIQTSSFERKAFFDIRCTTVDKHEIIVEMHPSTELRARIHSLIDPSLCLFYKQINQIKRSLSGVKVPVYFIAILDYEMDKAEETKQQTLIKAQLMDDLGNVFSDKLFFRFLQLPTFKKTELNLVNHFDKWCYFLKHAKHLDHLPAILNEPVFERSARTLEVTGFNKKELDEYEESLKGQRDLYALLSTSEEKARIEGKAEGEVIGIQKGKVEGELEAKKQIARDMQAEGFTTSQIQKLTGLAAGDY